MDNPSELTAEQKDTISTITTLTGVAIGATTGEVTDAVNASETAKVAVEDNYYYPNLDKIAKASRKDVEKIYNLQKSYFEGNCRTGGGQCNYAIKNMLAFTQNSIVKSRYQDLRKQTINKLNSRPELVITYLDNEFYKLNRKDKSILNTNIMPLVDAAGGSIGVVGSVGGTVYACAQTVGIGCYAAAILGSAGATSSWDHITTGLNNYGKPLSQQTTKDTVSLLSTRLGLSPEAASYIRQAIDILGTGGVGYSVAAKNAVRNTSYVPKSQVNVNNFNLYAGRTLIYHDNIGGHAVAKHVGKSDQQLISRLANEPRLKATSTFFEIKTAERAIGDTLRLNQTKVNNWLKSSTGPNRIIISQSVGYDVGKVINRGSTHSTTSQKVLLIIEKDALAPKGFVIITSFPSL